MAHWDDVLAIREATATATSYLDALLHVEHRGHDLLHFVATYADELVRTDEGWKIASRRVDDFLWRRESTMRQLGGTQ